MTPQGGRNSPVSPSAPVVTNCASAGSGMAASILMPAINAPDSAPSMGFPAPPPQTMPRAGGPAAVPVKVAQSGKPAGKESCDDGNPDADVPKISGDNEVSGTVTGAFGSGRITVCVNRKEVLLDTGIDGPVMNNVYDVKLAIDKLTPGQDVLVVMNNGQERRTAHTVVTAPKIKVAACDTSTTDKTLAIELSSDLRAGDKEIKALIPGKGKVSVCVNGTQELIADAKDPSTADKVLDETAKMDIVLQKPLDVNVPVLISWVSEDDTTRVIQRVNALGHKFGTVRLASTPKEGQNAVWVNSTVPAASTGSGSGGASAGTGTSLSVYINGDRVDIKGDNQKVVQSVAADSSGSQGIQLVNALDDGECVAVVAFQTGHPPVDLTPDYLECSSVPAARQPRFSNGLRAATDLRTGPDFTTAPPEVATSLFDYGRVRGYLAGGSLFSYDNGSFSQPSIFLDFNVTKNWLWGGPYQKVVLDDRGNLSIEHSYRRTVFETFFEARLTSLPVASCAASSSTTSTTTSGTPTISPSGGGSSSTSGACPQTVQAFVSSRKAATLTAGASIPFIFSTWTYQNKPYSLSMGPLAKIGLDTPTDSSATTGVVFASNQEFYTNFGFGSRIALNRMSVSTNIAPENIMYIDVVSGRFSNFDVSPANPADRYNRPWRFGFEGILKVPNTPFILGFSANIHQNFGLGNSTTVDNAKDDLRFLFGAKFDAGKLFSALPGLK